MDLVPAAIDESQRIRLKRRELRDNQNPFDISDARFIELYRFPKGLCAELIDEITPHLPRTIRSDAIPPHVLILAALNFYASGSYQRRVGQDFLSCMSQAKVSVAIKTVSTVISQKLMPLHVKFPQSAEEIYMSKAKFLEKTGVPGLIGLIDCTHVALTGLPKEIEAAHVNRKGIHSKNVQIICSSDMQIINVLARYPGSCHDSFIWQNSQAFCFLESNFERGDRSTWLFGDSGYPLQPWLMTPIGNPQSEAEVNFNSVHTKVRSLVERTIGLLKVRFRCLLGERKLRYDPVTVGSIINSCVVLHNKLVRNVPLTLQEEDGVAAVDVEHLVDLHDAGSADVIENRQYFSIGSRIRERLMGDLYH